MSRRQEPCRNFLRGSCRFGANCKFLHVSPNQNQNQQNQSKSSTNPFGFGSSQSKSSPNPFAFGTSQQQQQQQKPNPFGFGVQNKNSTAFQASSKPFENKWTRSASTGTKQTDPQAQASVHTCTDPESCRNIISDDFKNEAPLWKLTCYAHYKHLPCDIHGDISFEELRAAAYEDAKQGRNLQSIVERERNLLQSKLSEFENLLRKPYVPSNTNFGPTSQSNPASAFTSFSQLGAASNGASSFGPPAASSGSNNLFGQPSFSQNISQMPVQPEMKFGTSVGTFGSQLTNQNLAFGSQQAPAINFSFGRVSKGNANANVNTTGNQLFTSPFPSANIGNNNVSNKQQQQLLTQGLGFASVSPPPEEKEEDSKDDGIWLKEKWSIGEIPETAPPLRYCT